MRQVVTTRPTRAQLLRFTLNSDGRRHPLLNATTAIVFCAGIVAFVLGLVVRAHLAATILGLVTFAIGLYAQLVSATREQRIFIVTGVVGAFVGMGLGIAHGGFG
jgi:type IV secretory pathway TrbD component